MPLGPARPRRRAGARTRPRRRRCGPGARPRPRRRRHARQPPPFARRRAGFAAGSSTGSGRRRMGPGSRSMRRSATTTRSRSTSRPGPWRGRACSSSTAPLGRRSGLASRSADPFRRIAGGVGTHPTRNRTNSAKTAAWRTLGALRRLGGARSRATVCVSVVPGATVRECRGPTGRAGDRPPRNEGRRLRFEGDARHSPHLDLRSPPRRCPPTIHRSSRWTCAGSAAIGRPRPRCPPSRPRR